MATGKRALDLLVALVGLMTLSPLLLVLGVAIWLQDFRSPLYVAPRVGRGYSTFKMVKFRSMTVRADRSGVDSTSVNDSRITTIGRFLRAYKLDELPQLWNVLMGDMSLVGPRPQVRREVDIFTEVERELLSVKPGITDLSSIIFSDEGEVLKGSNDPDLAYNQLIRPWKSRVGLLYVHHESMRLDLELIFLTALALISRERALAGVQRVLARLGADMVTRRAARRDERLTPYPPPGTTEVVTHRGR
jgi:lipopolysaccharide/colanic/teichoic acid biosynthesis glycosyltransferase